MPEAITLTSKIIPSTTETHLYGEFGIECLAKISRKIFQWHITFAIMILTFYRMNFTTWRLHEREVSLYGHSHLSIIRKDISKNIIFLKGYSLDVVGT
eukprot:snap_masked-scaffold_6-processed-gene-15.41-mRNA-1 protein AED:1.00 eAED:1.00 QI:0/0/0/0/1/1/2/0/97